MTRSLSNIIKAAAVTYTDEVRKIDSNEKAEEFSRLFVTKHAEVAEPAQEPEGVQPEEFTPGISGLFSDRDEGKPGREASDEDEPSLEEREELFRADTERILDEAREKIKKMLADAEAEAEQIKTNAYNTAQNQGYNEGRSKAEAELMNAKRELERQRQEYQAAYEQQVQELEPAFIEMVIRLTKKLTGVLLEEKRDIVAYLAEQAISEMEPGRNYLIHVSAEEAEAVNEAKPRILGSLKEGTAVEVIADHSMKRGQCLIETDSRIFDCSLDTQLNNLICDLRMLAGSE